jgi:hypothetical protein
MWWPLACIPPLGDPPDFGTDGDTDSTLSDTDPPHTGPADTGPTGPPPPDADGDGVTDDLDCDDTDADIHPGHLEACGDGVDQDCDDLDPACNIDGDLVPDVQYYDVFNQGYPLWDAGDQNGDGLPEVIVGNASFQSLTIVEYDDAGLGRLLDVADIRAYGYQGIWQSAHGGVDLTGDGLDDVLVGGPYAFAQQGVVWVLPGPVSVAVDPVNALPEGSIAHLGVPDEAYGLDIETTDFDGDGALDLIGTADAGGHGAVYVSFGPLPEFSTVSDPLVRAAVFVRYDGYGYESIGEDVEAGDLDADGVGDLAFSSRGRNVAPQQIWFAYGTDPAFVGEAHTMNLFDARVLGVGGDPYEPPTLATGDLDGDGDDDVLAGLPSDGGTGLTQGEEPSTGAVLLFKGPVTGQALAWESAAMIVLGREAGDALGAEVEAVDLDSDGVAEIVVGSPREDIVGFDEGAVYVVDVASGSTVDLALGEWRAKAVGDGEDRRLGTALAAPGDVDGDGHADFAAGMIGAGGFWLFFGGPER